ncbi:MAG: hypothetical protein NTW26_01020, partial [bacterium]|nr:hypothetical protein [bacterium]
MIIYRERLTDWVSQIIFWIVLALCVFLGVFPAALISYAGYSVPLPDMFAVGAVLAAMYATVFLAVWATSSR